MKKLFLSLCAALVSMVATAQDDLVATLSHGDNIKSFYGVDALSEACTEAVDGDVITLSAGQFNNPTTIEKAITIRGAGMKTSNVIADFTTLNNSLTLKFSGNDQNAPLIEGIHLSSDLDLYGNSTAAVVFIRKCSTGRSIYCIGGTYYFKDCNLSSGYSTYVYSSSVNGNTAYANAVFQNCVLYSLSVSTYNHALVENCVIRSGGGSNSTLRNSIICGGSSYNASCDVSYCVDATGINVFQNLGDNGSNNWVIDTQVNGSYYQFLFENWDGYNYQLTETAAAKYIGNDGTQVGLFGGAHPFDPTITAPKVRKMVLNQQVNSNGKLGVTITVE